MKRRSRLDNKRTWQSSAGAPSLHSNESERGHAAPDEAALNYLTGHHVKSACPPTTQDCTGWLPASLAVCYRSHRPRVLAGEMSDMEKTQVWRVLLMTLSKSSRIEPATPAA